MSVKGSCGWRRRELLVASVAAVVSASGCSALGSQQEPLVADGALRPVLKTARAMVAAYEAVAESDGADKKTLDVLRDNHNEHVKALAKLVGESASADAKPAAGSLEELRTAESKAKREAVDACVSAPTQYAVLLGEIAACRASHHDVLGSL